MLVIAPKDNLVTTFPGRMAVVIEPSQWWTPFSFAIVADNDTEYCVRVRLIKGAKRWKHWALPDDPELARIPELSCPSCAFRHSRQPGHPRCMEALF
jgi:hypothetical protein